MKKAKEIWRSISRFSDVLLGHVLIMQFLYLYPLFGPYPEYAYALLNGKYTAYLCLVLLLPCLFSLVRIVTVFDDPLRDRFFDADPKCFGEKLNFLFRQSRFWVEVGVYAAIVLAVPLKLTYAVLADVFLQNTVTLGGKLLVVLGAFPLFFAVNVMARLSAMKYWRAWQRREAEIYYKQEKPSRTYLRTLFPIVLAYALGGMIVGMGIPYLLGILPFLLGVLTSKVAIFVAVVIVLFFTIVYIKRVNKRRAFLKRLAVICREKGYEVSTIECPYRSLFALLEGDNFTVYTDKTSYSCKFFRIRWRITPLVFHPDGHCDFLHIYRLGGAELYRRLESYEYGWEAEGQKIVILQPAPTKVCDPKMGLLDNGDIVGEYKIFTGTAFLNALERECVDRYG